MTETAEQPSDLIIPLLRYQKEWWALKQEESITRVGILADEIGMRKTVQDIDIVLSKCEIGQAISDSGLLSPTHYILQAVKGTLVICLVVTVIQWINEIDLFTTKGSNTILVYHGANREKNIGRDTMVLLTYKIFKTIMLRRTKKGRAADLGLPPRIVTLSKDCFNVKEEDYYRSLWDESRSQLKTW
ncbi:hypothetical protein RDI58_013585 [Solanum bulbocastanum]|uniref:SNF2 N-terminal domain-containing protein n=1 Tax=Solanum bulbocastanum TaxID=147425 RepID=A0AAN8TL84_SOLBU